MIHLGLVGFPLEHSFSPKIHSAALDSCSLEGDYSLFPIHPDDLLGLKDLLTRVRSGELRGLNVTIPHKQTVVPLLDELTPTAEAIGAVNTIYMKDNKLIGHNTDARGFLAELRHVASFATFDHPLSALVLGAGGVARAIVHALTHDGWSVTVAARRIDQARDVARQFNTIQIVEFDFQRLQASNLQLIVNATSIGMAPNADQSPWPDTLPFPRHAVICDLVYNPRETKLIKDARAQGLCAMTGLGMLVEQAALAFEIWTGRRTRRDILFSAAEKK